MRGQDGSSANSYVNSALIGVAIALIAGAAWLIYTSPDSISRSGVKLAPAETSTGPILISVEAGDSAADIGRRLEASAIIDSGTSFERLARIIGAESNLAAGEYEFLPGTSVMDAVSRIRDGLTAARIVTIPEGRRIEEVAALLEERNVVSADAFLAATNSIATSGSDVDRDLLSSRPASATLEGYLYPATYSFSFRVEAPEVVLKMVDALATRFTLQLREEARAQSLSVHQVLTLAAIVEREAVLPEERPIIASVYRNRIDEGMPLQADPTVQYAITARPGSVVEFGYWKRSLSLQDLQFDSTYNTYVKSGLPPGPIANPGIDSITAVIRPATTKYLFFVARNDGSHAFAETFEQHQANVARYQR
ncbi:MAG TPA: endolytic transglycosylase MltG [Dehalococcoidia bacterium]|nr:endolytic transglycosylase MltG [Dehalococcoidia bacterium]